MKIQLGIIETLRTEFIGFVSRINYTSPCEIECEATVINYGKNIKTTFKAELKLEIIKHLVEGTDITLSNAIPNAELGSAMQIDNATACQVLDKIKKIN
ncbi:MAG: hypothetical protein IPG85_09750 [Bacteroidetes bacterium]|nr:hypothetical protein [Bacteroidota bacterium]